MSETPRRRYPMRHPLPPRVQPVLHRALAPIERAVLTLAANGYSNEQIGKLMKPPLTKNSVQHHLSQAFRALGVEGRAHAVATALRWEIIDVNDIETPAERRNKENPCIIGPPGRSTRSP